jgi:polysaccharide biosynthesis protein PslG
MLRKLFFALTFVSIVSVLRGDEIKTSKVELGLYPRIGINGHLPKAEDLDMIKEAQIGWVRVDLTWNWVEPKPKQYKWERIDRLVREAEERGVDILAIIGYTPAWASQSGDIHDPPRDVKEWQEFVRTIVSRYKGRINYWTLWNEPNSRTFFRGSCEQFISEVLIPGAAAVREANPDAKVVGPDLAHLKGAKWDVWLEEILVKASDDIDILSHHCYKSKPKKVKRMLQGVVPPWDPPAVRRIIEKTGCVKKQFWLTEVGWRTNKISEEKQGDYIIDFLKRTESMGWVDKIFIYELKDSPLEPGFGLLRENRDPKPAFGAVKEYIASRMLN